MNLHRRYLAAMVLSAAFATSLAADPRAAAEQVVADALAGRHAEVVANARPEVSAALTPALVAQIAQQLAGARRAGDATVTTQAGATIVTLPVDVGAQRLNAVVVLDPAGQLAGLNFAPRLEAPSAAASAATWAEEDIIAGEEGWPLPGLLTVPRGEDKVPAVVLIHGSGPVDRDGTVGANKPYRALAHALAERGIASVRYDKRTRVHAERMASQTPAFTLDDEATNDAVAAVALARRHARVDPDRVFVAGHSLGAWVAPRVAARDTGVAGVIILCGGARPLHAIMIEQNEAVARQDGTVTPDEQAAIDRLKADQAAIAALPAGTASATPVYFGLPASYWVDLRDNDVFRQPLAITQPMLFLYGGRDWQVPADHAKAWKAILDGAGRPATWKWYPAMNHLLIDGQGPANLEEYNTPGTINAQLVEDIVAWIST